MTEGECPRGSQDAPDGRHGRHGRLWGIFGRPFVDLEEAIGLSAPDALDALDTLDTIDAEISRGLARTESSYTGGTLKWMGVVAPWAMDDGYPDAMHVLEELPDEELKVFLSLADDPSALNVEERARYRFGDETEHPFNRAQQRWLSYRHGVYFPWKVCYHLLENDAWEDKHSGAGKRWGEEALELFPETVRFLRALPFSEIGRAVIFGLEPNDHAPLHRATEPGEALSIPRCISICPRGDKRLYLQNDERDEPFVVTGRAYWFNDMDYHGVLADPFFRYSIRVDGVFAPGFVESLRERVTGGGRPARRRPGRRR